MTQGANIIKTEPNQIVAYLFNQGKVYCSVYISVSFPKVLPMKEHLQKSKHHVRFLYINDNAMPKEGGHI